MLLKSIVSWINAEITLSQGRCDILNLQSPAKTDDGSSDRSLMVDSLTISCTSQCSTTGVTKAVVCAMMSVGW